jgi:hypothetical protein
MINTNTECYSEKVRNEILINTEQSRMIKLYEIRQLWFRQQLFKISNSNQ